MLTHTQKCDPTLDGFGNSTVKFSSLKPKSFYTCSNFLLNVIFLLSATHLNDYHYDLPHKK